MTAPIHKPLPRWKRKLHEIVFEADTLGGKVFDITLLFMIIASVLVVMLDSVPWIHEDEDYELILNGFEWGFTILFTLEYIARIIIIGRPWKYIFSFFGIIDLLSILPSYVGIFIPASAEYLVVIRTLRLLRVFRLLKLVRYLHEANTLIEAMKASRAKILVFLFFILIAVSILGTLMYIIEAPTNEKFTSIPRSIYWAIVTLTTVGYGDISPSTSTGQFLAAIIMIMGYAVIAVPTGIVSAEFVRGNRKDPEDYNTQSCPQCAAEGHDSDATYCKYCSAELNPPD